MLVATRKKSPLGSLSGSTSFLITVSKANTSNAECHRRTRLAIAAAEARSGFPDTLRCAALGRLLVTFSGAPFAVRLAPATPGAP
ncbi:hypothetical protein K504DRAFT_248687 [Pleomassaria siparia CBS 279.74]|uniref:Uncharacterized protein n=1 Tax=Pleomassaria siparia CBS 279.74 TaxID=1314801 RepID=A0A6G1KAW8_9PLEO|nr:hypothetical protein K504DRAFT_248687 [Pleomassaria siparia CBS 279.74]